MKTYDELDITDDFMFSKIMSDESLCRELVEILLNIHIGKIEYLSNQNTINEDLFGRGVRLDVYLKDSDKVFDIEMQTTNKMDLPKRARYYQAMIDIDNLNKGAKFNALKESYVLFICTFDPFGYGLPKYSFREQCEEINKLNLNDKTYKVFYNALAYETSNDNRIQAFLQYLSTKNAKTDFTKKLDRAVYKAKGHEYWRKDYMTLAMKYDEWREEGLEEGRVKGIREGRREGRREGIQQTKLETARNLLLMNILSVEQISIATGLTLQQLQSIKEEI